MASLALTMLLKLCGNMRGHFSCAIAFPNWMTEQGLWGRRRGIKLQVTRCGTERIWILDLASGSTCRAKDPNTWAYNTCFVLRTEMPNSELTKSRGGTKRWEQTADVSNGHGLRTGSRLQ